MIRFLKYFTVQELNNTNYKSCRLFRVRINFIICFNILTSYFIYLYLKKKRSLYLSVVINKLIFLCINNISY